MIFLFISSVQSLSRVRLFSTPWIAARQASLSITNSRSSLRLTSIVSVMPSSHLILCRPLLLSFPVSESFPMSQLFAWGGQSTGVSALASFLPKKSANIYFTSCFFFFQPEGTNYKNLYNFPRWCSGTESTCQCRRHKSCRFHPWVGKIPWRRKWQSTPVFLPGEVHEQRSLVGYSSWSRKESDMTEHGCTHLKNSV